MGWMNAGWPLLARCLLQPLVYRLIQRDSYAGRTLKDMKELAERKRKQPCDDEDLVRKGNEPVIASLPPCGRRRKCQACNRNCEQQNQRHQIESEALGRTQ